MAGRSDTVTLIRANPSRANPRRRHRRKRKNPTVSVPVAGPIPFPSINESVGMVGGAAGAAVVSGLVAPLLSRFTDSMGRVGNALSIAVSWGGNLFVGKQVARMVNPAVGKGYMAGASVTALLQMASMLVPDGNLFGLRIPAIAGVRRAQNPVPVSRPMLPAPATAVGSTVRRGVGASETQTDPVTGDDAFITVI